MEDKVCLEPLEKYADNMMDLLHMSIEITKKKNTFQNDKYYIPFTQLETHKYDTLNF